jgi:glycosyltransferase involved in cell wall biosynthesis
MKIVFLAPFGIRPKGTVLSRMLPLAEELQKPGHKVVIIAPPYTNPEDSGKTELINGVRLVNVSLPKCGKICGAILIAWRMLLAMRNEQPGLVHLFKPKGYGGLTAMFILFLQRLGIRLPALFADTDDWEGSGGMNDLHNYSNMEKHIFALQEKWLTKLAKGVTVASRTLEGLTVKNGVPEKRIFYLPNCVDSSPPGNGERVREQLGIARNAPVLLLYTRFFEFEQEKLHAVFADVRNQLPGVRFLVVGKGRNNEEAMLVDASRKLGFTDSLVMAGWVDKPELPDYLAAGDVAIYPFSDTLINRAKCPVKLTELLKAGVPVVADCVGQIPEYFDPALHNFLCLPDDWLEMASKCVKLLEDEYLRRQVSSASRTFITTNFKWGNYVKQLHNFYLCSMLERTGENI